MFKKTPITPSQLFVIELAVVHGYRRCKKGDSVEQALKSVRDLYEVKEEIK